MPSVSVASADLSISWGTVGTIPARSVISALPLRLTFGEVVAGPGDGTALAVTAPTLNRLTRYEQLTNPDGTPSVRLMAIWQEAMDKIEGAFAALSTQVGDNTTLLNQIRAAQALARAANDNAEAVSQRTSLSSSYTDPVSVLTASSDGSVAIAAHNRVYGDGSSVSVSSGSISGFAGGDYVTIYYVDAGREGGAVTYQATKQPVAQEGATHIVGQVTIPVTGTATGSGTTAPGYNPPSGGGGSYDRR